VQDVNPISNSFFEGEIAFSRIRIPKRLLIPFFFVLLAKTVASILVYYSLNVPSSGTFWTDPNRVFAWEQNNVFLENLNITAQWSSIFLGWDSAWYLSIMTKGYAFSSQSYSFFPGLPVFGSLFNFILQDPVISLVLCVEVFGVLWVPAYQLVAENYMSREAALGSALLFAFSPYVFLFTTVAYSEGLFLFFTLGAWHLFKKGKVGYASLLAAVAAVTRVVGVLVVLPMVIESLKKNKSRRLRNALLSCLPIVAVFIWLAYCQLTANDWLASIHSTEWNSLYSFRRLLFEGLPAKGIQAFAELPFQQWLSPPHWLLPVAMWGAIIVPPFIIYKIAKVEKSLAVYSLAYYVGVLAFGALVSTPRFISVLFPLWIPLTAKLSQNKKSVAMVVAAATLSFAVGLDLWINFLNGQFIA
jgi:hypothetical protein